jgi:hypothetical protein
MPPTSLALGLLEPARDFAQGEAAPEHVVEHEHALALQRASVNDLRRRLAGRLDFEGKLVADGEG